MYFEENLMGNKKKIRKIAGTQPLRGKNGFELADFSQF